MTVCGLPTAYSPQFHTSSTRRSILVLVAKTQISQLCVRSTYDSTSGVPAAGDALPVRLSVHLWQPTKAPSVSAVERNGEHP